MDFINLYSLSIILLLVPFFIGSFFAVKYARSGITRLTVTVLFLVTLALAFLIPIEFTGYPKPVTMEWYNRELPEANLLWGGIKEDVGIFVLLDWGTGPRFYQIAFDVETASDMQEAMRKAEQQDGQEGEQEGQGDSQDQAEGEEGEQGQGEEGEQSESGGSQGEYTTSFSGRSGIIVRYPFLSKEERAERLKGEGQEGEDQGAEGFNPETGQFDRTEVHSPPMFYVLLQQADPPKTR